MLRGRRARFFVDLDKTLAISELAYASDTINPGFTHVSAIPARAAEGYSQKFIVVAAARPSARPFLLALRELGEVDIITMGSYATQVEVLKALELHDLITVIWAPDNTQVFWKPRRCRWLFIDDRPVEGGIDDRVVTKLGWLGVERSLPKARWLRAIDEHFVQCRPWDTVGEDPEPLTDLMPIIHQKFELQKHRRRPF